MLLRPTDSYRVFPPVGEILQSGAINDVEPCARALLAVARTGLSRLQLRSGWHLDPARTVARVVALHLASARAELDGAWATADYLWDERDRQLNRVTVNGWSASAGVCGFTGDPEGWRRLVLAEIILDTHCAFYNGYSRADSARRFLHLDKVDALATSCGLSDDERRRLVGPARDARIQALRQTGDRASAVARAWDRLTDLPDSVEYQREYVELVLEEATENLVSPGGAPLEAAVEAGIRRLMDAVQHSPRNAYAYDALATLHRTRGVQLANEGHLSKAFLHIGKARSYNPQIDELLRDEQQLNVLLSELRNQMQDVAETLASQPGAALSAEGERLRKEAQTGSSLLTQYRGSPQEAQTRRDGEHARAYRTWRLAGLPEPPDRWVERATALARVLDQVLSTRPTSQREFDEAWLSAAANEPDVADISPAAVMPLFSDKTPANATVSELGEAEALPVAPAQVPSPREPFAYWVFTPRDPLVKALAVAALVLVVTALVATISDAITVSNRTAAFQVLMAASEQRDDTKVIAAAERFFAASPLAADPRVEEALHAYEPALLRWLAGLPANSGTDAQRHLEQYKRITATLLP